AYFYFEKMKRFGDVPWYGQLLDVDSEELFKARDPRTLITDSIIADLNYAIARLRTAKTPATINRWTALALKSRVCLFEGTFRKYHTELQLQSSADPLLEAAAAAANEIMNSGSYGLATGDPETVYLELFAAQTPNADEFI